MSIRIAFRYGDTRLFSRVTHFMQRYDSSHCEVAWAWNELTHECVSSSFLDGGVRGKSIVLTADKWRVYELPGSHHVVIDWLNAHHGERYDVVGLLGFVFRRIKGWAKAWFCSEVAADILGLSQPWRYDLALLESVCKRFGRRIY